MFDADAVIGLHAFGIWNETTACCNITLTDLVAEDECQFYDSEAGRVYFDLKPDIDSGRVTVVATSVASIQQFQARFKPNYISALHEGETTCISWLSSSSTEVKFCTGDNYAWRVFGALGMSERALPLETLLDLIGLRRKKLSVQFTQAYCQSNLSKGVQDRFQDRVFAV